MEMMKIPHTDLEVSRLAMGCMGLGDGWDAGTQLTADHERQAREFLDAAEEIGVNFFDHANIYARGRAEVICLRKRGQRVVTFFGFLFPSRVFRTRAARCSRAPSEGAWD